MRDLRPALPVLILLAACDAPPASTSAAATATLTASAAPTPSALASTSASSPPTAPLPDFSPAPAPSSAPPLSPRGVRERQLDFDAQSARIDRALPHHLPIRTEDGTFLIVAAEPSAPLDAAAAVVHDTVTALFHGPFAHRGERAFVVWVFSNPAHYAPRSSRRVSRARTRRPSATTTPATATSSSAPAPRA